MLETNKNAVTVIYSGGDVQVPFLFYDAADLVVLVETTMKTMGTDYTVTGGGNTAGGKVAFMVPPTDGERVTVIRKVEFTQLLSIPPNGIIPEGALSKALDRIVMMVQQLSERADRAVEYPEGTDKNDVANAQAILDSIEQGQQTIDNAVAVAENTLETANSKFQEIVNTSVGSLQEMQGKVEEATLQAQNSKADADRARQSVEDAVYANGLANPNLLVNGDFSRWPYGDSGFTTTGELFADGWSHHFGAGGAQSVMRRLASTDYAHRAIGALSGYQPREWLSKTVTIYDSYSTIRQDFFDDLQKFDGQNVSLSFVVFTENASTVSASIRLFDASWGVLHDSYLGELACNANMRHYVGTAELPKFDTLTSRPEIVVVEIYTLGSTGWHDFACIKLELGSIATPFEIPSGDMQELQQNVQELQQVAQDGRGVILKSSKEITSAPSTWIITGLTPYVPCTLTVTKLTGSYGSWSRFTLGDGWAHGTGEPSRFVIGGWNTNDTAAPPSCTLVPSSSTAVINIVGSGGSGMTNLLKLFQ